MLAIAARAAATLDSFNAQETSKLLSIPTLTLTLTLTPTLTISRTLTLTPTLTISRTLTLTLTLTPALTLNAQETSKLLYAMRKSGVHCAALEEAASRPREQRLELPLAGPPILLTHMLGGGRAKGAEARRRAARRGAFSEACRGLLIGGREETGATAATGGALWEGSLLLAKWLAAHPTPAAAAAALPPLGARLLGRWGGAGGEAGRVGGWAGAVQEPSGRPPVGVGPVPVGWAGRSAVELGAGLGLPAIVAGRLGMRTVATDADEDVLSLLEANAAKDNAATAAGAGAGGAGAAAEPVPVRVRRLKWGEDASPLETLGLGRPPDVLLAVDVVYGREERVWSALVRTRASRRHASDGTSSTRPRHVPVGGDPRRPLLRGDPRAHGARQRRRARRPQHGRSLLRDGRRPL